MKPIPPKIDTVRRGNSSIEPSVLSGSAALLSSLFPSWLALAWLISKAQWFWSHNPELQFGWIIVMLCGYLMWESWETRPEATFRWDVSTCILATLGCGLLGLTQLYQAAYG